MTIKFTTLGAGGRTLSTITLKRADILACRFAIMVPEHYREDGTCKCDDPQHRAMMIREWGYLTKDFA